MLAPCANCSKIFPAATFSLRSGGKVKESSKLKASKSSLNSSAAPLSLSPPALGVVYTSRAAEPSSLPTGELLEHQGALASPGLRLASPFLLSKRPDQPTTWPRRVRAHAPWAPAGVSHPTWPLKLQDSSPEEILKGKGGRAYRIALTGLVKLGHLPDGGSQDFEEFSEESADMSEDTTKASPSVTARSSTVSVPAVLQSLHQSAVRRISSLRLPRVRPTISKVLAGLSPSRMALPTANRLMPPIAADGGSQVHELTTASLPVDGPLEDKGKLGVSAVASSTEQSTALGSESIEFRSGSKQSKKKASPSGTVESAERPPEEGKGSPKHAPILEEDERLQSSEGRKDSHEFLGNVDQEHDVRMSIRYDPSDSVREDEVIDDAKRSHSNELPKPPADAPLVKVIHAVAPSSSPPALTPVAPNSPAPGVPKHRQRALAVFRSLISPR